MSQNNSENPVCKAIPSIYPMQQYTTLCIPVFEQTSGVTWSRGGRRHISRSCLCDSTARLRATAPLFQKFGFYGDKRGMSTSVIIQFVGLPSGLGCLEKTRQDGERKRAHVFMRATTTNTARGVKRLCTTDHM